MANTGKTAGSRGGKKKVAAARAEAASKNGKPDQEPEVKGIKYHKLELRLPDSLPETVMFDITDMEAGVATDDPRPVFRLLRSVLGPDQFVSVRNIIESENLTVGDEVIELMKDVLAEYGLTAGESGASE